jgi:two-component system, chemotaxis family, sensor kinase CheA
LLDQIHGKGKFDPAKLKQAEAKSKAAAKPKREQAKAAPAADDEITEDEFDALLDQIHGKGKFDPEKVKSSAKTPAPKKAAAAKKAAEPSPKPAQKPAVQPASAAEAKPASGKAGTPPPKQTASGTASSRCTPRRPSRRQRPPFGSIRKDLTIS